jgi:hypothetical protein
VIVHVLLRKGIEDFLEFKENRDLKDLKEYKGLLDHRVTLEF